jgi:AcrR family transcriptional regulator
MAPLELPQLPTEPLPLTVVGDGAGDPCERADAKRNRVAILEAAKRLFDSEGVENVSMDAIAAAAGVGKGTLFRRFGDRAGLALALLNESETAMQDGIIRGAPPLGPGAPAADRLVAFARARYELLDEHVDLILAAETSKEAGRYGNAVYGFYRAHMISLLRETNEDIDPECIAEMLLASLSASSFAFRRRVQGMSVDRIVAGWEQVIRRILASPGPTPG